MGGTFEQLKNCSVSVIIPSKSLIEAKGENHIFFVGKLWQSEWWMGISWIFLFIVLCISLSIQFWLLLTSKIPNTRKVHFRWLMCRPGKTDYLNFIIFSRYFHHKQCENEFPRAIIIAFLVICEVSFDLHEMRVCTSEKREKKSTVSFFKNHQLHNAMCVPSTNYA